MCNVNIATGELLRYQVDLFLPGYIPVEITRIYNSGSPAVGILGTGWSVNLLTVLRQDGRDLILVDEDAVETRLMLAPGARHFASTDENVTIVRDGDALLLDRRDGKKYRFPSFPDDSGLMRLAAIEDPHNNRIAFHYGLDGLPKFIVDTVHRRLFFRFDDRRLTDIRLGTESSTVHDAMLQVRYLYDAIGQLVGVEDAAGGVRRFEYEDGLLVREVDPLGRSIFWSYDDHRRCVRTWRDGGILSRTLDFDDAAMTVKVTDALGYTTVYGLDEKRNITSKTDPLGQSEQRVYDATGNLLATSIGMSTRLTLWDRDSKCLTDAFADGGQNKYHFDASDRLVRIELGSGEEWRQEYDERGDITQVEAPGGERWSMEYSREGYVARMTNSLGHTVYQHREVDAGERVRVLADDIGEIYRAQYDIFGNLTAVTDAAGNTTRRGVDRMRRVTEIQDPEGGTRSCRRDAAGRIIELEDETGDFKRYEYGPGDHPLREIDSEGQTLSFEYDLEQQLTAIVDRRGHRIDISHDALGRVTKIAESDGRIVTQSYVPGADIVDRRDADGTVVRIEGPRHFPTSKTYPDGRRTNYQWKDGMLQGGTGPGGAISREFDPCGRLVREVQDDWAVHTTIDARNNLTEVSEDGGRSVQYDYDSRRRVTSIRDSFFGEFRLSYDSTDLLTRLDYPNGFAKRLAYDRCDRMILTALEDAQGGILIERRFEYDRSTRVVTEAVARRDAAYTKRFHYDRLGRLSEVLRDGTVEEWYRYDAADNIRACHLFADSDIEGGDRIIRAGLVRYDFDGRGNRIARRDGDAYTFYDYDADGRLSRVVGADRAETAYRYDPVGRRLEKRHDGHSTRYHWLVDTVFKESSDRGDSHYLFLPTTFFPIAMSRYGERYFVFFDQIASPRELLSWDGRIVWSRDSSAFGVDRVPANDDEPLCPLRFQGQYRDPETGLDYNYHRHYDAVLGRYLSPDPLGIEAGPNRYRYVPEPLTWIDPYGLFTAKLKPRCDWNKEQMKDFEDKVNRYNAEIERVQEEEKKEGITISPCARSSTSASELYKKCNDVNGKKQEGSPDGQGKPTDCKDDIDHIIDKQMGGKDICKNFVPVNASVNRSLGSQMKREISANPGKPLTWVEAGTKEHCDDTTERTPACK